MMPAFVASALIVFTLSLDDFLISFFCSGPTAQTLSLYVYAQVRSAVDPSINALSACLVLFSSLAALIMSFFNLLDEVISND
jgi:spermidine/putrescine transport system permease protein